MSNDNVTDKVTNITTSPPDVGNDRHEQQHPNFFHDPYTAAIFFAVSGVSATAGNWLLCSLRRFLHESQYSVLTDRLEAFVMLLLMAYNVFILAVAVVILALPAPSAVFCAVFTVVMRQLLLITLVVFLQLIAVRMLYMTLWKNVGMVNDDFFVCFLIVLAWVFAGLYGVDLAAFGTYENIPSYVVCSQSDAPEATRGLVDPVRFLMYLAVAMGLTSLVILVKERKKLHKLHVESRTVGGLPRVGETHQSLENYKNFILVHAVGVVTVVSNMHMVKVTGNGLVFFFPYSVSYIVCMLLFAFSCSTVYPLLRICNSPKLRKNFTRKNKELVQCLC